MKILDIILPLISLIVFGVLIFMQYQEAGVLIDEFGNLFK